MRNNRGGNQPGTAPYEQRGGEGLGGLGLIGVPNLRYQQLDSSHANRKTWLADGGEWWLQIGCWR